MGNGDAKWRVPTPGEGGRVLLQYHPPRRGTFDDAAKDWRERWEPKVSSGLPTKVSGDGRGRVTARLPLSGGCVRVCVIYRAGRDIYGG